MEAIPLHEKLLSGPWRCPLKTAVGYPILPTLPKSWHLLGILHWKGWRETGVWTERVMGLSGRGKEGARWQKLLGSDSSSTQGGTTPRKHSLHISRLPGGGELPALGGVYTWVGRPREGEREVEGWLLAVEERVGRSGRGIPARDWIL